MVCCFVISNFSAYSFHYSRKQNKVQNDELCVLCVCIPLKIVGEREDPLHLLTDEFIVTVAPHLDHKGGLLLDSLAWQLNIITPFIIRLSTFWHFNNRRAKCT